MSERCPDCLTETLGQPNTLCGNKANHPEALAGERDEVETAFETLSGYLPNRDGTGVSANAALELLRSQLVSLREERDQAVRLYRIGSFLAEGDDDSALIAAHRHIDALTAQLTEARAALREAKPVLEFVSRGRGYVGVERFPDATARRALAMLHETLTPPETETTEPREEVR